MQQDVFEGFGIKITLDKPEDFLIVKETLTRIGIASVGKDGDKPTLTQTCHILHKRGEYAIMHFKELFLLDGGRADLTADDIARRNAVGQLIDEWGLAEVVDYDSIQNERPVFLKVVPHGELPKWNLKAKYHIGKAKRKPR